MMKRQGFAYLSIVVAGFSALAVVLLHPLSTDPSAVLYDARTFEGGFLNQPDVTLHAWILAWDHHKLLAGDWSSWFDANIFFPAPGALAHSDHMIGALPFFAPFFASTGQLALSFNLWVLSTFVMSGVAASLVAFAWTRSRAAALVAGVAFAFAPWRFNELSHPQLLSVQFLPVIAFLCLPGAAAASWARAGLLAVALVLQGTSSAYLGYLGFLIAGLCLAGQALAHPRSGSGRLVAGLILGALPVALLSLPYLDLEQSGVIVGKIEVREAGWALLGNYLFPPAAGHHWMAWWLLPVFAAVGCVVGWTRPQLRLRILALLACAVLSSLFAVSQAREVWGLPVGRIDDAVGWLIPGWTALRVMTRFGIVTWLALSLLASFAFVGGRSLLLDRMRATIAIATAVALLLSASALEIRARPAPEIARDLAPYEWLAANGGGAPLLEWPARLGLQHSEAQYMSHLHWLPMVNGYSGYTPPWNELMKSLAQGIYEPDGLRSFTELGWARWLLVRRPRNGVGLQGWDALPEAGAKLVTEGEDHLLFELPFSGESRMDQLLQPSETRTLLGTRLDLLGGQDLEGSVEPAVREIRGPLGLGPHLRFDLHNRSRRTWPGVAVGRDRLVGVELRARRSGSSDRGVSVGFFRLPTDLEAGSHTRVWTQPMGILPEGGWELVPCLVQWGGEAERCYETGKVRLAVPGA